MVETRHQARQRRQNDAWDDHCRRMQRRRRSTLFDFEPDSPYLYRFLIVFLYCVVMVALAPFLVLADIGRATGFSGRDDDDD